MASLRAAAKHLFEKQLTAVATHAHYDHVGGLHEFPDRAIHGAEAAKVAAGFSASLSGGAKDDAILASIRAAGYLVPDELFTAVPDAAYDPKSYGVAAAPPTRTIDEGDVIDLGNRRFEVLHLPGHSPGSIGLWEARTGTLFSGDAIYDGPLLDEIDGADIRAYIRTMKRLRELPVEVVHAGHDPSFGRARLIELVDAYLAKRA
jgi:glyoxylase-like metal-dependent hydrolase (beta-lactamase superfamily II)